MIRPMVLDLEVDATLGFIIIVFFNSQKELSFTKSYLQFFLKKAINGCGIWAHFQESEKCFQTESGLEWYYL